MPGRLDDVQEDEADDSGETGVTGEDELGTESAPVDHHVLELIATILLGLAALAIGWSTFQSALWGGQQDEGYTESVREADNAVDLLGAADTIRTLDQSLFVEVVTSGVCDADQPSGTERCDLVLANMSDEGAAAVQAWLASDRTSTPFETDAYLDALYGPGGDAKQASQVFFEEAGEANQNGDDFNLAVTLLTVVLVFAGISIVTKTTVIRWSLVAAAGVVLIGSAAFMLGIPTA